VTAIYRFGRFEVNPGTRQLLVDAWPAPLGARAFDVLLTLVERRDRLVTKDELLQLVWPGLVVEENNLQVQISALRKMLGMEAIATIPGRGYRFALNMDSDSGRATPPVPKASGNLPVQLTSFVGRNAELDSIKDQLRQARLVTLTGMAGSGKTRLSVQAAASATEEFPDGAWFVELATISDPALLPNAVAHALGVTVGVGRSPEDAIQDFLRTRQLLLVIDNCEHLIGACAEFTHGLLVQCPGVKVLATSREAMTVPGEISFAVPPLSVPEPNSLEAHVASLESPSAYDSVCLFVDRAVSVRPDFTITSSNAPVVAEICLRLDGIPLAIELAAARARALSPQEILSRLGDRFQLLTGGSRTALPRQQTLRAAIDWSYDLLAEPERVLLRRLSVFAGGCTLAAVEVVGSAANIAAADVLDLLSHLVEKSLVIVREGGGETRYQLLETIREYGNARLREMKEHGLVRDAHFNYFLQLARTAEPRLRDAGQVEWLGRVQAEIDNLRAALEWAHSAGKTAVGLELARVLGRFWHIRGDYSEGRYWLQRVQELPDATDFPENLAWVLYFEGLMRLFQSDPETIKRRLSRSLDMARSCANRRCEAYALDFLGVCASMEAKFELAESLSAECQPIFREIGDTWGMALNLWHAGENCDARGDSASALGYWEQSLAIFQQLEDEHRAGILSRAVGLCLVQRGDVQRGAKMMRQALQVADQRGAKFEVANTLWAFSDAVEYDGDPGTALELRLAAATAYDSIGGICSSASTLMEQGRARAWFTLHQEQYDAAFADGRALSTDSAIELALGYRFRFESAKTQ
jgi:non-specific serine/threonine protein kinase